MKSAQPQLEGWFGAAENTEELRHAYLKLVRYWKLHRKQPLRK